MEAAKDSGVHADEPESKSGIRVKENPIRAIVRNSPRMVLSDEVRARLIEIERTSARVSTTQVAARLGLTLDA